MKVKVRIALAATPDGKWNCCGASGMDEDDMMSLAVDTMAEGETRFWLNAEVEIPEIAEHSVQVEKA